MLEKSLKKFAIGYIETILTQHHFYNDLSQHDNQQFNLLLEHSKIIEIDAGEKIIRKGDIDKTVYFLLKGCLEIHRDEDATTESINQLTPGQVFGALAAINEQPRIASVSCSDDSSATVPVGSL